MQNLFLNLKTRGVWLTYTMLVLPFSADSSPVLGIIAEQHKQTNKKTKHRRVPVLWWLMFC